MMDHHHHQQAVVAVVVVAAAPRQGSRLGQSQRRWEVMLMWHLPLQSEHLLLLLLLLPMMKVRRRLVKAQLARAAWPGWKVRDQMPAAAPTDANTSLKSTCRGGR